ncbi:hypothetical protein L6164_000745 [Bauhinia variegata]|uniref:Uncharacterized protein n=1 Tax=Bauhinia variegata TaxID=167791 RepID=A0ACB9Q7F5_BAUVA|nr:hypothetical protein L6164_000745 [Bauhinia variegata]
MEEAIVLYPIPVISHFVTMVELGKFILTQHPSLSIHILITTSPYDAAGSISPYIASVPATISSIKFHNLPAVTLPPTLLSATPNHESLMFEVLKSTNPNVHQVLLSISQSYTIRALIMDFFCYYALSIASQFNIPGYYFYPSGTGSLTSFLYEPTINRTVDKSYKDLDTMINFPGVPPVHSSDMPKLVLDRNDLAYENVLASSSEAPKTAGIIVNTFEALEPRSLKAITDGLCIPNAPTPPVYCLGPLIGNYDQTGGGHGCLKWLNMQPKKSVVFLCFGSLGLFSKEQLKQIGDGLEKSGKRFLWVVRNPPCEEIQNLAASSREEPDLDSLLPEGFLDRTKGRGLVVKKWAPQMAVLTHESVGGFVTHCGWSSVLEAVCSGVPMIAWPLYAEQRINRILMVEEMKIAVWMHESESGLVSGREVEERVRELMESERGEQIRKRVMLLKDQAEAAMADGGSSRLALTKLLQSWNKNVDVSTMHQNQHHP